MPPDPRVADGSCPQPGFDRALQPWQTGGTGAGDIPAEATNVAWPPAQIVLSPTPAPVMVSAALLPSYTPTGTLITLPTPTFANATVTVDAGNGVANPAVTQGAWVPIAGCAYINEYDGNGAAIPTPACGAPGLAAREPMITPPPV